MEIPSATLPRRIAEDRSPADMPELLWSIGASAPARTPLAQALRLQVIRDCLPRNQNQHQQKTTAYKVQVSLDAGTYPSTTLAENIGQLEIFYFFSDVFTVTIRISIFHYYLQSSSPQKEFKSFRNSKRYPRFSLWSKASSVDHVFGPSEKCAAGSSWLYLS